MYRLIIEDEEGRQSIVPVARDEITIGRRQGNTIRLNERNVSRTHARILVQEGHIFVEDAGSRYGLKARGLKVSGRVEVTQGDDIEIGSYHLSVMVDRGPTLLHGKGRGRGVDIGDVVRSPTVSDSDLTYTPSEFRFPTPDSDSLPRLVLTTPDGRPQEVGISGLRTSIGRTTANDVAIVHPSVRRRHAFIVREGDHYVILAAGDAPIKVNGVEFKRSRLQPGDRVELGSVELRFEGPRVAPPPDEETAIIDRSSIPGLDRGPDRTKWYVAAGVGLALLLVLVFLIPWGGDGEEPREASFDARGAGAAERDDTRREVDRRPEEPVTPPSQPREPPVDAKEKLDAARVAMEGGEWLAALTLLDRAGNSPEIEALKAQAREEHAASRNLEAAADLASHGDWAGAMRKLEEIPERSRYRAKADTLEAQVVPNLMREHNDLGKAHKAEMHYADALEEYERALAIGQDHRRRMKSRGVDVPRELRKAFDRQFRRAKRGKLLAEREIAKLERRQRRLERLTMPDPARPRPRTREAKPVPRERAVQPSPPAKKDAQAEESRQAKRAKAKELYLKGRRLHTEGRFGEAERLLKQAISLWPGYPDPHFTLALIYTHNKNKAKAIAEYRRFLRLAPQDPRRPRIEARIRELSGKP